ncbi:MAG: M56 family metallopeptidase, partial [Vicinamibacterales bacterium]
LLNWLWQGGLLALAAQAALGVFAARRTQARLVVWWTTLGLVLVLPLAPFVTAGAPSSAPGGDTASVPMVLVSGDWRRLETALIVLWCAWSVAHALRFLFAVRALRRVKAQVRPIALQVENTLRHWTSVKANGRSTRLVLSDEVRSAAVLGGGTPDVAVAPLLASRLSPMELDQVVIHEWAHVQRRDDIANIVQVLVGVIAGWHPAIRWIDRQLRLERETACDEIAVSLSGSARGYAACLARLASLPLPAGKPLPVPAALSSSGLRRRVERILRTSTPPAARWSAATITALAAVCLAAVALSGWEIAGVAASRPAAAATTAQDAPALPLLDEREIASFARAAERRPARPSLAASIRAQRDAARDTPHTAPRDTGTTAPRAVHGRGDHLPPDLSPAAEVAVATLLPVSSGEQVPLVISVPPDLFMIDGVQSVSASSTLPSPWRAAADAGVAVGRGSQNAAVKTAGLFTRFGRTIAESF